MDCSLYYLIETKLCLPCILIAQCSLTRIQRVHCSVDILEKAILPYELYLSKIVFLISTRALFLTLIIDPFLSTKRGGYIIHH